MVVNASLKICHVILESFSVYNYVSERMGTDVEGLLTTSSVLLFVASFDVGHLGGTMLFIGEREVFSLIKRLVASDGLMKVTSQH